MAGKILYPEKVELRLLRRLRLKRIREDSSSFAPDIRKVLRRVERGPLPKSGVKSLALHAILTLAVSALSMGVATAAPNNVALLGATTATPAKVRADTGMKAGVKVRKIAQNPRETWRRSMVRTRRPKKGCFKATYPETTWREIKCTTPPNIPYRPRKGVRPETVGNGTDFSGQVTGNTSQGEGSFDAVTGVTSENASGTANVFSLQLNTNTFSTSTCSGAANPAICQGWEQFIFSSYWIKGAFIQYWLLTYGNACPSNWISDGAGDCYVNSANSAPVPTQTIAALGQMKLDGAVAGVNGDANDEISLSIGSTIYSAPGDNHFPDLTNGWRISEFNVFGDASSLPQATFNTGSTIVVRTAVNSGMPAIPPTCTQQGFTGETNNLTMVSTPAVEPDVTWPSIIFTESNAGTPTPASCDNADSIGDTHLKTFAGLFYDFQASGDFVLAEDGPDFLVQARQASGAPTWPNASINKGIAMQMGKTSVALYVEPDRLVIDGRTEDLADGRDILLPTGVQVSRRANLYVISSENGNNVRVVLNGVYIDVHVGLGRGGQQPRGLLGNPNRNINQLVTATGVVLRAPVAFADLYHGYADGWRVQANQSLLTEATTIRPGIPDKPFFANHLNPQDRARALAICRAARIANKTLLDACTLDTVVLNDEGAVRVFVRAPRPRAVIKPVLRRPVLRESVLNPTP